jgi:glutamine cyclotransferase
LTRIIYVFVIFLTVGFSCKQSAVNQKNNLGPQPDEGVEPHKLSIIEPQSNQIIRIGQYFPVKISYVDSAGSMDSLQFLLDALRIGALKSTNETFQWNTEYCKSGTHVISVIAFKAGNKKEQQNIPVRLFPEKAAPEYTYKIIATYPHDPTAYTQGLLYDNGDFIEGTGLKGQSSLRKVKIQTGEIIKSYKLPDDIFGEGVATYQDKIVQISWQDQVAFIYDKTTFTLLNKLSYPFKEGWGITYDNHNLIMSDGSSNIYFLDKDYLSETSHIEVCDNHGPVARLNELEYVDGEIWANIYYTDTIARIDPKTGIIIGKIDMSGLLKKEDRKEDTNVLNGIAYDPQAKRIWVTGKNWPKLFQISVLQKVR